MVCRSWWIDLTREQFAARLPSEAARMAEDRKRVLYSYNPKQFADAPRRAPTVYRYHLEADVIEP